MKTTKLIATLALSALLFTGCGPKDQNAIIKINDKPITKTQYDKLIDKSINQSPFGKMGDLKGNKDGFLYLMMEQKVINQLIITELLNQEADARGIKVSKKELNEATKEIMDQIGGSDKLSEALKQSDISVAEFKESLKTQIRMQKLADSATNTNITDKDCETYYKKNPDKFKNPEQVRASHILIAANPFQIAEDIKSKAKKEISTEELTEQVDKVLAEKKAEAERISRELKADSSQFEQYAKKYSEDPGSAQKGGDLGYFAKEQMVPEFSNAAFSAKPNTVLDPVKTQFGYHIIMVQDRRAAGTTPYEKAKSGIKDLLKTEKRIEAMDKLTDTAKKKAKIEYMDERYNPENIQKKLTKQVDDATNGQASKVKAEFAKQNEKK